MVTPLPKWVEVVELELFGFRTATTVLVDKYAPLTVALVYRALDAGSAAGM